MEESPPGREWNDYYGATLDKPLHPTFGLLDPWLPTSGLALELGFGVGHGILHLLEKGLDVVAVEGDDRAISIARSRLPEAARVEFVRSRFEDLALEKDRFDVVIAQFSIFFLSPGAFAEFWGRLVDAIKPGGLFLGQFLGVNDGWKEDGYAIHDRAQALRQLAQFEPIVFDEVERDGETAVSEPKHWHVFHVLARKNT